MDSTIVTYASVALIAVAASTVLLFVTKSPALITVIAASVAAVAFHVYAWLESGQLDKFIAVSLLVSWVFAFVVSLIFVAGGRMLGLSWFDYKNTATKNSATR